jgi:hypothetical protein
MPLPIRKTGKKRKRLKDFIPSNARWFLADLLGIDKTFTEEDLTSNELEFLQNFVKKAGEGDFAKDRERGFQLYSKDEKYDEGSAFTDLKGSESLFDLIKKSYNPEASLATTLGQFGVSRDDEGNFIARDNYDFNTFSKMVENMRPQDVARGFFGQLRKGNPYKALGILAGRFGTSEFKERGNPVRINLGRLFD